MNKLLALSVIPVELAMQNGATRRNKKSCLVESVGKHTKAQIRVPNVHTARDLGQHFPVPLESNFQNAIHLRLAIS